MNDVVTKAFCDERTRRVVSEVTNKIDGTNSRLDRVETEMKAAQNTQKAILNRMDGMSENVVQISGRMDNFGKEIAEHAKNAGNGKVEVKMSGSDKKEIRITLILATTSIITTILSIILPKIFGVG